MSTANPITMNDLYSALTALFGHAKDHMSADELRELGATLTSQAGTLARNMDQVAQGLACLVTVDGDRDIKSGSFQDADSVFVLLCTLAQQFDTIAGMVQVGTEATWKADEIDRQVFGSR